MIQRGDVTRFLLEAREAGGIRCQVRPHDFERDVAAESRVASEIHLAHPAGAHRRDQLVCTQSWACRDHWCPKHSEYEARRKTV